LFKKVNREEKRKKRHGRIRSKIVGTTTVPRMSVYRSLDNIFVQFIDDSQSKTLLSASSIDKELKTTITYGGNVEAAKKVGEAAAKRALEAGIKKIVFDRSGYLYTGRVKALADAAREAGLEF